jgi:hypothetical protein
MQIRLFVDEDAMANALVSGLRARGIDVLTAGGQGRRNLDDDQQLEFATSQGRVLYTFNTSDFYRIHIEWLSKKERLTQALFLPRNSVTGLANR